MAFFCEKTGVRIAGPGVSKSVDPDKGQPEVLEVDGVEVEVKPAKAKKSAPEKGEGTGADEGKKPEDDELAKKAAEPKTEGKKPEGDAGKK